MTGVEPVRRITDPMELPTRIAVRILELAYLYGENEEDPVPEWDTRQKKGSNPLRSVVPLVSHRWRALLLSHDAQRVLWRRVAIHDCTIPRKFCPYRFSAFWEPRASHVLELDVDILFTDKRRLDEVAHALIGLIAAVTNLRSLRLTGHLPVGFMLRSLEDRLQNLHSLSSVYLAGGDPENWHPEEAVQVLAALNNLRQLEIRFRKYVSMYRICIAAILSTRRLH
jgi:hypothetical protein